MKRVFWFVMLLILITVFMSMLQKIRDEESKNDYEKWELSCMKEYEESKDYFIFIDVTQHKLSLFKSGEKIKEYRVASGAERFPSPLGVWSIIRKDDWGEGFGGQWMGLNVPWGVYGIHGTQKPGSIGHNASHGCIRMYSKDAAELASIVKYGTKVEIYGGELGPFGSNLDTLYPGDRGSDVMEIQKVLKSYGYFGGYIDGVYGPLLEKAVIKFEKDHGLALNKVIGQKLYKKMGIIPFN